MNISDRTGHRTII